MAAKFQKLEAEYEHLLSDFNILKCKLECKTDGLLILCREQEQCKSERDQYKLMANQLRERYSALKRRVEGWGPSLIGVYDPHGWKGEREQSLVQLLCELKEQNKSLQCEVDDLKQKLADAHGDIRLLREGITRARSGSNDDDLTSKHIAICDKEQLVKHLEKCKYKSEQLERDLLAMLDEKEELVMARDAFRLKFERLNQQLNCLLRGDQHSYVDIDGVIMENRYLNERIKQVMEEKNMATTALSRCKGLLDKKRSSPGLKFSSLAAGLAISAKQVEQLLQNNHFFEKANDTPSCSDVKNLVMTLLEALSDNTIALSHQKKTNKILGKRMKELEEKLKDMETASLWRFSDAGRLAYLSNATISEDGFNCDNLCLKIPDSPEHIPSEKENISLINDHVTTLSVEVSIEKTAETNFSDLDLLPTKDDCSAGFKLADRDENTNSVSKSQDRSPLHIHSLSSDSEGMPCKTDSTKSLSSSRKSSFVCNGANYSPSLDIDDLPPKLQKLIEAALSDLGDDFSNDISSSAPIGLNHQPSAKGDESSC